MENRRIIVTCQEPYVGIQNQRLVEGVRGDRFWESAGGGGNFIDPSSEQIKALIEYGSSVAIYENGHAEPINTKEPL